MMYVQFPLSLRNVDDLLAERWIDTGYKMPASARASSLLERQAPTKCNLICVAWW